MLKMTHCLKLNQTQVRNMHDAPKYRGIYIWLLQDLDTWITYIGESRNVAERLREEGKYFDNGLWNYYDLQNMPFPNLLAEYMVAKEPEHILSEGRIFIPWQGKASIYALTKYWCQKLDEIREKTIIMTFENTMSLDNKKIEAYLITKVMSAYKKIAYGHSDADFHMVVKGANSNHTPIGHRQRNIDGIEGLHIEFADFPVPKNIKKLLGVHPSG